VYSDVHLGCCRFALSVPQPSDCLERLVPEMTHYVLKETFNSAHSQSLTISLSHDNDAAICEH